MPSISLGKNYFDAVKGKNTPLFWDTLQLINPHMLILGASGVGKSHTIRKLIRRIMKAQGGTKVRFHVFDVHGDLDIPGASVVRYSETAPYGLNPLRVNPDLEYGGVRLCIRTFLSILDQVSKSGIGVQQEAVLSELLEDVFREFGFDDNPASWSMNAAQSRLAGSGSDNRIYLDVPMAEKDEAKGLGARWDPAKKLWWVHLDRYEGGLKKWQPAYQPRRYPTIEDVLEYTNRIHLERFLGTDQKGVMAVQNLNKRAQAYQRQQLAALRVEHYTGRTDLAEKEALEQAREDAKEAAIRYFDSIQTGQELASLRKYNNAEVLKSIANRLKNLWRTGIFKDVPAPFDEDVPVWRYHLRALQPEEKKMFVLFTLQQIFARAVQRGESSDVVEIVVLDELGMYTSGADKEDGEGIIGTICREARKFGLGFWGATQSPASVPESLLTSTATKILLGLDETYWPQAVTKLRVETKLLDWVQPWKTMAVQLKERGALKNRWHWVQLDED